MSVHDTKSPPEIALSDYQSLAELRYQIRKFLRFSEQAARNAGLEPAQHQFLLAVKGLPENLRPTVGVLAERLQIQPHSAVELLNRLAERGFVRRCRNDRPNDIDINHRHVSAATSTGAGTNSNTANDSDRRQVLVNLTAKAEKLLLELALHHRQELQNAGPALMAALEALLGESPRQRAKTANSYRLATKSNGKKGVMHVTFR